MNRINRFQNQHEEVRDPRLMFLLVAQAASFYLAIISEGVFLIYVKKKRKIKYFLQKEEKSHGNDEQHFVIFNSFYETSTILH